MDEESGQAQDTRKISRRDFLKLTGVLTGLGLGARNLPDQSLNVALSKTAKSVDFEVPEYLHGIEIPQHNDYYRPPEDILGEACETYLSWSTPADGLQISFTPRENYLDVFSLAQRVERVSEGGEKEPLDNKLARMMLDDTVEQHVESLKSGGNTLGFSALSINGSWNLLAVNPGAGIVNRAVENLRQRTGWSEDQYFQHLIDGDIDEKQIGQLTQEVTNSLSNANEYFEQERDNQGAPLSCSTAIAYFLYRNKGDLYQAMWDTTLFFKFAVRNDMKTLGVSSDKDRFKQAKKIGYLLKDEFSPHFSHNWLVELFENGSIPPDSPLTTGVPLDGNSQVNFQLINKSGTYYHGLNLMTWAAVCMSPRIAKIITLAYYNTNILGGMDNKHEHGREKLESDMLVVKNANQIKEVVNHYT